MRRLIQVADEVQKELERQELLGGTCGRIAELGRELIDLVHDASSWWSPSQYLSAHVASLAMSWPVKVSASAASSIATLARAAESRWCSAIRAMIS
jgi:hypothetical protein